MRYEKKEFRDFSEGEGQKFFREDGYFDYSSGLQNTEKTGLMLAPKHDYVDVALTEGLAWFSIISDDIYQYIVGYNAISELYEIWQRGDFGEFAMIRQLPATTTALYAIFKIKNRICVSYTDDGADKLDYTDDQGANWTTIAMDFKCYYAYNIEQGKTLVGDNETGLVYTTVDGETYELLFDFSLQNLLLYSVELYKNFNYFICTSPSLAGTEEIVRHYVFRLEADGLKQVAIYDCALYPDFFRFNDYLVFGYCKAGKAHIERFNGDTFETIAIFDDKEYAYFYPLGKFSGRLYFSFSDSDGNEQIGWLDENWSFYRHFLLEEGDESWLAEETQNQFTILAKTSTGDFRVYHTLSTYEGQGELHSSIVNEGEIIPKQIKLTHQPIEADINVKVYTKHDFASDWTLKLTSDTVGAVKKVFTYPAGLSYDFLQFKIELNSTASSKTPKTPQLTFLYLPKGLASAK